jgi:hypothetical protein
LYGRRMYEVMRYWDDDRPEWTPELHDCGRRLIDKSFLR